MDIYEYVSKQKNIFETGPGVPVAGNWYWKMYDHNNYTLLMKNGQFPLTQTKMGERPQKNIILPILNVAYRTEGFDVKDIEPYVNNPDYYHLSLLVRKFHPNWARENHIDTFIDTIVETLDYGYCLVKAPKGKQPEVIQPQQIAFCDQTDMLSGAMALKHQFSVDQLKDTISELGWYKDEVNEAIRYSKSEKTVDQSKDIKVETPSNYIEVFEVHGTFEDAWLESDDSDFNATIEPDSYTRQVHIITYVRNEDGSKKGLTLYKGREKDSIFKLLLINPIFGRAAGRGRVEALFEPQIWVNNGMIHMYEMLKEASKVLQVTDDPKFSSRNNIKNLKNGEYLVKEVGTTVQKLDTTPSNINLFDNAVATWEQHARTTGSASDPALGIKPASGTPLGTTEIITAQGEGIHEYIRGQVATFVGELYSEHFLNDMVAEMNKGNQWIDELTLEELQEVAKKVSIIESNKKLKKMILDGKNPGPEEQKLMQEEIKKSFMNGGKTRFLKIMQDELKDLPVKVFVNVAGKQKNQPQYVEKLSNVFRSIFANPQGFIQTMQIPAAARAFSDMLEASGLSPMDFSTVSVQEAMPENPVREGQDINAVMSTSVPVAN